jgi:hypothetical protein
VITFTIGLIGIHSKYRALDRELVIDSEHLLTSVVCVKESNMK